jgi:hypothetical protein
MKKAGLIIILVSAALLRGYSQNIDDALRYSQIFYNGTARFMGMGGAFSALGGDLSSISLNPAGTGVFRSSELTITLPQMYYNRNSATWNGTNKTNFSNPWKMGQIGAVINLIPQGRESGLVSLNLAYSFNRTNNFSENVTISNANTPIESRNLSSIIDSWSSQANGNTKSQLFGAPSLAYQTYLIDTLAGSNDQYVSILSNYGENTNNSYGQTIKRVITNDGYSAEHAISIGANFSNKLYLGATLGINKISYSGLYQHEEIDDNNLIYDFKNLTYTDHLEASGTGYSFKIGAIVKPVEFLRVSLALHSPTYYRISEYYFDNLATTFDTFVNGQNSYEASNLPSRYKYTLTTPFRAIAGVAVQIKKLAMLSFDYDYTNYSMAQFSKASDGYNYSNENQSINDVLKPTSNFRFGAEFRVNSNIYLRGGYSYYGKAFNTTEVNKNLDYKGPSFGFGFRQQKFYFDMAYSLLSGTSDYYMYNDPGYLNPTTIKTTRTSVTATLGFKF